MLQLNDAYYRRQADGTYSNLIESFQAISCMDDPDRPTVEESDAEAEQLIGVAPRLFPYTTGSYSCTFFPAAPDPRIEITGIGAGPIVVIGTTGDPSTPLESSRAMADALEDGRFVIVVANQHTGYGVNDCVERHCRGLSRESGRARRRDHLRVAPRPCGAVERIVVDGFGERR